MKPEKLILEGVYSYKHRTEIDFSTLCRADLFGIFGNVGSGKSAILEAVTYVLYGKIERLSTRVYYNMMNLASDIMSIDFIFSQKEERYRFTFEARRSRKDFDKIETPARSGYVMKEGEWLPLFDKDGSVSAEGIIGLSYDNFRRTVIVPQGRFQEFLHLEKAKRTEMLMDLFRLNRFDLYAGAAALGGKNAEQIATVEGALSGLLDADAAAVVAVEEELASAGERSVQMTELLEQSSKRLRGWEELAGLQAELEEAEAGFKQKQSEAAGIFKRKKDLQRYETCRSRFDSPLEVYRMLSADYKKTTADFAAAETAVEAGRKQLQEAESRFEALKTEYDQLDYIRKQSDWFLELAELVNGRKMLGEIEKSIEAEQTETDKLNHKKNGITEQLDSLNSKLSVIEKELPDLELMNRLQSVFGSIADCDAFIESEKEKLLQLKSARDSLQSDIDALGELDHVEASLDLREEQLRKAQLQTGVRKSLETLAGSLEAGKPCPVCGSTEHPAPVGADGFEEEFSEQDMNTEELELQSDKLRLKESRQQLSLLQAETASADGRITAVKEQIEGRISEKNTLIHGFPECAFSPDDRERFTIEYGSLLNGQKRRSGLLEEIKAGGELTQQIAEGIRHHTETVSRLKVDAAAAATRISEAEQRMDAGFLKDNSSKTAEELTALAESFRERSGVVAEQYSEAGDDLKNMVKLNERNVAEFSLIEKRVKELAEKKDAAAAVIEERLADSDFNSIDEVGILLDSGLDSSVERAAVEAFEKSMTAVTSRVEAAAAAIDGRNYDFEKHEAEKASDILLKNEHKLLMNRTGELGNVLSDLNKRLEKRKKLEMELTALKTRRENINLLKNLFKGKKFIDYAATIYLRELCEAANARFRKLTRESLRLELDETNNFIIRDYLNEGKTRSVKTLSGGQTFQAAFSLSLALADSIGRERSGFFFLDEGFGSLDRESLSLVFDSLKSLKKEERTVGIISHVEELKQEIDTFIAVTNDNDEGSMITSSWSS